MANNNVTVKEVLMAVIERLNEIAVPMKFRHQIADNIEFAVRDIQACVEAISNAEREMAEKKTDDEEKANNEEPVIELVPEEVENPDE